MARGRAREQGFALSPANSLCANQFPASSGFKQQLAKKPGNALHRKKASAIALNRAICAAADAGNVAGLLQIVSRALEADDPEEKMSLVNIATALHRLGRMYMEERHAEIIKADLRLVVFLQQQAKAALLASLDDSHEEDPRPRCLSTIAWASARLQICDPELMAIVGDLSVHCLPRLKSFELANLLWGFAKLNLNHAQLFTSACNHVLHRTAELSLTSISTIAWAFATVKPAGARNFVSKLVDLFAGDLQKGQDVNPVNLANIVWALACSGVRGNAMRSAAAVALNIIGDAAVLLLPDFKAHELSITLWAFARLEVCHDRLFAASADRLATVAAIRSDIHAQGIANVIWSFAKQASIGCGCLQVLIQALTALLPVCKALLPTMSPLEFSSLVWSASKLGQCSSPPPPAAEHLLVLAAEGQGQSCGFLERLPMQGVVNILAAYFEFYKQHGCPPEVVREMLARLLQRSIAAQVDSFQFTTEFDGMELAHEINSELPATLRSCERIARPQEFQEWSLLMTSWEEQLQAWESNGGPCHLHLGESMSTPTVSTCASTPKHFALDQSPSAGPFASNVGNEVVYVIPEMIFGDAPSAAGSLSTEPAYIPIGSWLEMRMPCPISAADFLPASVVFLQEFTDLWDSDEGDDSVEICFEVNPNLAHAAHAVKVEICVGDVVQERMELPLDPEALVISGMSKLALPAQAGSWTLRLTLQNVAAQAIGAPSHLLVVGQRPIFPEKACRVGGLSEMSEAPLWKQRSLSCRDWGSVETSCGDAHSICTSADAGEQSQVGLAKNERVPLDSVLDAVLNWI